MISGNEDRLQSTMYKKCGFFKNSANCVFEYLKAEVLILILFQSKSFLMQKEIFNFSSRFLNPNNFFRFELTCLKMQMRTTCKL